jgi:hypothetical protein
MERNKKKRLPKGNLFAVAGTRLELATFGL